MIHAPRLLTDLTRLLKRLEDDLRARIAAGPDLAASLRAEWQAATDAQRSAEAFESWTEQIITQAGVHWLLSGVFLRFIEDNALVERPWLAARPNRAGWRWRATGTKPISAPSRWSPTASICSPPFGRPAGCRG